ncbi:DUF1836 domain-containing protein [Streptococcus halichoeri]|uniref:DUF1836 domain-containing protein n=1 Tax=Streptococcus halichoeri TaxID=254785 RepID=UPI000DB494C5|nr:DUF1836 domain-containing protein [Streptococcus halichoeri]PZO96290.1 MAG: hypothetical protein DI617_01670 [Streptococcus pyogenes]
MTQPIPQWNQLPQLDLYLDQVLLYVNQVTSSAIFPKDKGLTASMINNYVKHGYMPKPQKKKYNRQALARLIVISILKPVFAIQDISRCLAILTADGQSETAYNSFVACMNGQEVADLPPIITYACQTLNYYQKTQALVLQYQEGEQDV